MFTIMKINNIINIFILSSFAAAVVAGCSDDLGNYDYTPINEVSVVGSESDDVEELVSGKTYHVVSHVDEMKFSPVISSTFGEVDEDRYEYEWRAVPSGAETENIDPEDLVLGRERCIDIPVTLAATTYNCFFNVKDKVTGITWSTPFYLQVRSLTGEGWLVLCDDHDRTRIDIIFNKTETEDIIARDVLSEFDYDLGKPQRIFFSYGLYGAETTMLVTDRDSYLLDGGDLHAGDDNRVAWNFGIVPDRVNLKASARSIYAMRNLWAIIDENDDVYTLDLKTYGSFFEYPVNKIGGEKFKPAPFIGVNLNNNSWDDGMENCNPVILYDETNSQFVVITNTSNYPQLMEFSGTKLFDNPTGGRKMVWMESTHSGVIKSVLRDPSNGDTYYYAMSMYAETIEDPIYWWLDPEIVPYNQQDGYAQIIGPGVERAEQFTFHGMFPYVFYTVDNKVYQFNLGEPDVPAVEVLSFPGEDIVNIKFNPFVGWHAYQDWERQREYDLVVCTNNPSLDDSDCGTVRFYNVPNLMKPLSLKKEVKDFGRIKDIVYKERSRS